MFFDTSDFKTDEIRLVLAKTTDAVPEKGWLPAYHFAICDRQERKMGMCQLRIGWNEGIYYSGHIGYAVDEAYRGRHYAGKACRLLLELAARHGMAEVIITCNPDNIASAKTCEYAGGEFVEIAELPPDNPMRREKGETHKRIYRVKTGPEIRRVGPDELESCLAVIRESFRTVADGFGLTQDNCPKHTSFMTLGHLNNQMNWGWQMFALYEHGRIVGYASLSCREDGAYELHNVAVLPECRRKGYGSMLINHAKTCVQASDAEKIVIGMIAEDKALRSWYERNGFVLTGTKKFEHLPFTTGFMEWRRERED